MENLKKRTWRAETNGGYIDTRSVSRSAIEWTGRDLNPRPPECKSGVHARLNYRPAWNHEDVSQTKLFLLTYGNIKGKKGERKERTILEDYSIYIFNI